MLPVWLAGTWTVRKSKVDGVSFPQGKKFVSEKLPGFRMVSILPLPNVGNTPKDFDLMFLNDGACVRIDREGNLRRTLEAFWPSASVLNASSQPGRVLLRYESPTRSSGRVAQLIDWRLCNSEGGSLSETEFVIADVVQQDNIEQGVRTAYEILQDYQLLQDGSVKCVQRIAAFLQPTDSKYFEAAGKAVAYFDYSFELERRRPSTDNTA